jgi:hypothetical protein
MGDATYYLNKGKTVTIQGKQYITHSTITQYRIGQHEVTNQDMALIDRRANGCVCGDDMLELEGSERFVDVSGLGGYCENKLWIVTAQALISTRKGDVIAVFIRLHCLVKGQASCHACKWNTMDPPSTISLSSYLEVCNAL